MLPALPAVFFPVAIAFAAVHFFALVAKLYYFYPWFDIPMHTMGGFLVVYGLLMLGRVGSGTFKFSPLLLALTLFAVMVAWEVFEYFYIIDLTQPHLVRDTISDVINGAIGGTIAYLVVKK